MATQTDKMAMRVKAGETFGAAGCNKESGLWVGCIRKGK